MKKSHPTAKLPAITAAEVATAIENGEVIYLRVSTEEKASVKRTASVLGLTVNDYLMRCHTLVASKLPASPK